jgi:CHAD domain-containing protein
MRLGYQWVAMDAAKRFQRWRRRLAKLRAILPGLLQQVRTEGAPEHIHQLRVALRRMRLLARLSPAALGERKVAGFHDWSRRISDQLGPIRDCDVTLEWLEPQAGARAGYMRLRAHRDRLWKLRRKWLLEPKPRLLAHLSPGKASHRQKANLHKSVGRQLDKLVRQAAKQIPRYFELSLRQRHEFRRCIRRWRYLRELALPQRKFPHDPTLIRLVRLQEALGDYQNRVVARRILIHDNHAVEFQKLLQTLLHEQNDLEKQIRRPLQSVARLALALCPVKEPLARKNG